MSLRFHDIRPVALESNALGGGGGVDAGRSAGARTGLELAKFYFNIEA
jgi:hypothetical protein